MPPLVDFNNSRDTLRSSACFDTFKGLSLKQPRERTWEINRFGHLSATETFCYADGLLISPELKTFCELLHKKIRITKEDVQRRSRKRGAGLDGKLVCHTTNKLRVLSSKWCFCNT